MNIYINLQYFVFFKFKIYIRICICVCIYSNDENRAIGKGKQQSAIIKILKFKFVLNLFHHIIYSKYKR